MALIKEKTETMEKIIAEMKDKANNREKLRISKRNIIEEDGFIVEVDARTETIKEGMKKCKVNNLILWMSFIGQIRPRKRGGNRMLANWFAKQYGSSCC